MTHLPLPEPPPRVPAVEPELLASAIFLYSECLEGLALTAVDEEDEAAEAEDGEEGEETGAGLSPVDTRAVLDLFAEDLGTSVPVTLALYMRVTALFRLLAASPGLARLAATEEESGAALSEDALLAAARLDLHVARDDAGDGSGAFAAFDPREFRAALLSD